MNSSPMGALLRLLARLPLPLLHRLGELLGWIIYLSSRRYAARLRENLRNAGIARTEAEFQALLHANIREAGKGAMELPWVWLRPEEEVLARVLTCHGWEHVQTAAARGKGLVFLTPHLGCFEVSALYAAKRMPITVLYRPPKQAWLEPLLRKGRERGQVTLARTDVSGVRALYRALKRGEAIGLLPDQVPGNGEGEWREFFGKPAYTMTLVGRLIESSGATALMAYAERLPDGAGFAIHIAPLEFDPQFPHAAQINKALEAAIRACPAQYLWSYNRYKIPRGAPPPDETKEF